jgi:DNA-3-methyladenine glycosylase I
VEYPCQGEDRMDMKRCEWSTSDIAYIEYHDKEWGVPVHDDRKLFEMLLLEGAQAGLSWITILKRRETYRLAYDGFDPGKIVQWDIKKMDSLLKDPGIIRNRRKIEAAKTNAGAFLRVAGEFGSFDKYIWAFVGGQPIHNGWTDISKIPVTTTISERMSKDLKRRGFRFVGSTICYAFMQAVGMVNDHITSCFRYNQIRNSG